MQSEFRLTYKEQGAFDNVNYDVIKIALERKGIHNSIIRWIDNMLKSRVLQLEMAGELIYFKPSKGCPQGGSLSPLLWTLVVDEVLYSVNAERLRLDGFADDLFALIIGFDFSTMSGMAQRICTIIESWCIQVSLSINPEKVKLVIFSKKRNRLGYRDPVLFGKTIKPSNEVKYLGVVLDQRLNWNKHLESIIDKTVGTLFTCKNLVGKK